MPTVFALARTLGAGLPLAYVARFAVAVPAVLITAMLWARRASVEVRSAAFVVTALLVQPYLMYYDLAWLILPIIYLCGDRQRPVEWTSFEGLIISLVWILPIPAFLAVLKYSMPWFTVFLPILLFVVLRRAAPIFRRATSRASRRAAAARTDCCSRAAALRAFLAFA